MTFNATHSARLTRLDATGAPTGDSITVPIRSMTMTTPGGATTMYVKLDPTDPEGLSDYEAAHLATRPTKAQVAELLDDRGLPEAWR